MKRYSLLIRYVALAVLVAIGVYAVSAGDWLRAIGLVALLVLLTGCATPPAPPPPVPIACPALPMPKNTTRAARDAHALTVIKLYGQCAAARNQREF